MFLPSLVSVLESDEVTPQQRRNDQLESWEVESWTSARRGVLETASSSLTFGDEATPGTVACTDHPHLYLDFLYPRERGGGSICAGFANNI